MSWGEIAGDVWTIPGDRMKAGADHSVPLAPEALALLGPRGADGESVFGRLDNKAMRRFVVGLDCTIHGFRSTFSDWAAESGWDFELRELALAHAIGSQTARSYSRSAQVDRRREMMEAWAKVACHR